MKRTMPEIIAMGAYDAALIWKNTAATHPRRVHLYEIEWVTEDGGTSYIDGKAYPIRAHHVIVGKPGQMRHTLLPFKCLYLHVIVEDEELSALLNALPDVYAPADDAAVERAMQTLITAYTDPDPDGGMQLASAMFSLFSTLIRDARRMAGATRERGGAMQTVERAIAFIDANDCQNITLAQVAEHVHLSRIYFHRLFVAATGRTPHRYLLERRISRARQLLMTTDMALCEIAMECGFSSQSYFNQVFQREMGCSPGEYKRDMSLRY